MITCSNKTLQDEDLDMTKYNLCVVINCPRKSIQKTINYNQFKRKKNTSGFEWSKQQQINIY